MATLLTVTGNPSTYTAGTWPQTVMDTGVWRFTFVTAGTSASGTYSGFHAFFCGPIVSGATGGIWIVTNSLQLYDTADTLVFDQAMTFGSGQTLTFLIDVPNLEITISGATTGNGTFPIASAGPYFTSGTLTAGGVTGQSGFEISGTIGDIDDGTAGESIVADGGTFALTGTAANLSAGARITAEAGAFAVTGTAADLTPGTTGSSIGAEAGVFTVAGTAADVEAVASIVADSGSFALTGTAADLTPGVTSPITIGDHGFDFQPFPLSGRDALITLDTQVSGSVVVLSAGGNSADVGGTWTENKGNSIRKLAAVQDYPDFGGYGTQVGVTRNAMTGGTTHEFTIPCGDADENTSFAVEIIGGRRVKHLHSNEGNAGSDTTQSIGPITTDGPAVLIAFWWGSSPVVPPFPTPGGPGGGGIGTPFTAVPDNGFVVLESYLENNEFGEVQGAMAGREVTAAGSYSVTWTHSPAQGAQLWLVAIEPPAELSGEAGSFAVTGTAADLVASAAATIEAGSGAFAADGGAAGVLAGAHIVADPGAFALTGTGTGLLAGAVVGAGSGSLAVTGGAAGMVATSVLAADSGALAVTGSAADLRAAALIAADSGALALTGTSATITASNEVTVDAETGAFSVAGAAAAVRADARIVAGGGTLAATGTAAELVASAEVDPITLLEDAVHAWVVAGSGLAADNVIWAAEASDSGPVPVGTYISLRILGINRVSSDWLVARRNGSEVVFHVRGSRHPRLELTCFAGARYGAQRAAFILDRVTTSILMPSVAAVLRAAGVGIGKRDPIRVIEGRRSGMFDPRAITEVALAIAIDLSDPAPGSEIVRAEIETPGRPADWVPEPPP